MKIGKNAGIMPTINRCIGLVYFTICSVIPLSMGQVKDTLLERVDLNNASFELLNNQNALKGWEICNFENETPPDIQPGQFGCTLAAQQGKSYVGMAGRDNGTFEVIQQVLSQPLKAGVCYRMSVYLAKSSIYSSYSRVTGLASNYSRPLKLVIWGTSSQLHSSCEVTKEDWLTESLPIHNDQWRKYIFYIQPPKDVYTLIFSAGHVVQKPYNGNLLIDNISTIVPVNCTDFHQILGEQRGVILLMQRVSKTITIHAPQMVFGKKNTQLPLDTEVGRNKSFDQLLAYFEQTDNYKLVIRLKQGKKLSKERIAFLYSYIFKHTTLKAQRVDIKHYSPKDESYFWTFENDELAMSFDTLSNDE